MNQEDRVRPTRRRQWIVHLARFVVGAGVIAAVGAGAWGAVASLRDAVPRSPERRSDVPMFAEVASSTVIDAQPVAVDVQLGEPARVKSAASGLVTDIVVAPGAVVEGGDRIVRVDGIWRYAYMASAPPYRDLLLGDRGDDVIALTNFLRSLGFEVSSTDVYGTDVRAAVTALDERMGVVDSKGVFRRDMVVWVPAADFVVGSSPLSIGDSLDVGAVIVTDAAVPLVSARVRVDAPVLFPGSAYVLDFGDDKVIELGTINAESEFDLSAETLALFTPEILASTVEGHLTAQLRLAHPIVGLSVLPSALIPAGGSQYCLALASAAGAEYQLVDVRITPSRGVQTGVSAAALKEGGRYLVNPLDVGVSC